MEYLKNLKDYYLIEISNYTILMIHGNQFYNDSDNIEKIFDKIIEKFDFDICLFGHTHRYLFKKYKHKYFFNPGSVGQSCDSSTYKYCILEITDKVNVILKEFDVKELFNELVSVYKKNKIL